MNDLINWILTEGRLYKNVPDLIHHFGLELQKNGMFSDLVGYQGSSSSGYGLYLDLGK